jgi:aspartate/methionine/tyrosine aminotransferase
MSMTRTKATFAPPVMQALKWLDDHTFSPTHPLINVSQAAPVEPPPQALRAEMARLVQDEPDTHVYGPVLGLPALRTEIAKRWCTDYAGDIAPSNVAVTAGCNQAFAAAVACLTDQGDEIILPVPWYFNHKMCLDMAGVTARALPTDTQMLPDPAQAAHLITPRTKAIALVSPNNPAGVEYPESLISDFFTLAQSHKIALILDETYRDFDSRPQPPHRLFQNLNWSDTVVQLYSFSKAYRLTGHRVGALVASQSRLGEIEKFLDSIAICAPQLGQHAALWAMQNLRDWLAAERLEILDRRRAISQGFNTLKPEGWQLLGLGAYFAYFRHPFALPSDQLAQRMVRDIGVLALPGTMFTPTGDPRGETEIRVAFANIDKTEIENLFTRLQSLRLSLAQPVSDA